MRTLRASRLSGGSHCADVETAREPEVEPGEVSDLLPSQDNTCTGEDVLPWRSEEGDFLSWSLLLVTMLWRWLKSDKDLEHCMTLVDKVAGLERTGSIVERSSTVGEMLPDNIACCREIIWERKSPSVQQIYSLVLRKCHRLTILQQPPL